MLSELSQRMSDIAEQYGLGIGDEVTWGTEGTVGVIRAIVPANIPPNMCYPFYNQIDFLSMRIGVIGTDRKDRYIIQRTRHFGKEMEVFTSDTMFNSCSYWVGKACEKVKPYEETKV